MIRICALALATISMTQTAQSNGPLPQGLWSAAVRNHSIATDGPSDEARELGSRVIARLSTGAQSALRLTTSRQDKLRPDLRGPLKILGQDAAFEAKVRALEERKRQDEDLREATERSESLERQVQDLEKDISVMTKKLEATKAEGERVRQSIATMESSLRCRYLTFTCPFNISEERAKATAATREVESLERQIDGKTKMIASASASRGELRQNIEKLRADVARPVPGVEAITGFYRAQSTSTCKQRLVFRAAPGIPLKESPFLNEDAAAEDLNLTDTTLYACVDSKRRLIGVEATDQNGSARANSQIDRDRRGRLSGVQIFGPAAAPLEYHEWSTRRGGGYTIIYRGFKGGEVRATVEP